MLQGIMKIFYKVVLNFFQIGFRCKLREVYEFCIIVEIITASESVSVLVSRVVSLTLFRCVYFYSPTYFNGIRVNFFCFLQFRGVNFLNETIPNIPFFYFIQM